MRCLAKDPSARWPDGRSLREAVVDAAQVDEELHEKRTWFDGLLMGQLASACYAFVLLLAGVGGVVVSRGDQGSYSGVYLASPSDAGTAYALVILLMTLFLWLLLSLPIGLVAFASMLRKPGWGFTRVRQLLLRQPAWWRGWYPAWLRHPATAARWRRLPLGLRALQTLYDVSVIVLLFTYLPAAITLAAESLDPEPTLSWPYLGNLDVRAAQRRVRRPGGLGELQERLALVARAVAVLREKRVTGRSCVAGCDHGITHTGHANATRIVQHRCRTRRMAGPRRGPQWNPATRRSSIRRRSSGR